MAVGTLVREAMRAAMPVADTVHLAKADWPEASLINLNPISPTNPMSVEPYMRHIGPVSPLPYI